MIFYGSLSVLFFPFYFLLFCCLKWLCNYTLTAEYTCTPMSLWSQHSHRSYICLHYMSSVLYLSRNVKGNIHINRYIVQQHVYTMYYIRTSTKKVPKQPHGNKKLYSTMGCLKGCLFCSVLLRQHFLPRFLFIFRHISFFLFIV